MTKIDFQNFEIEKFSRFFSPTKIIFRNIEIFNEKIFFGFFFEKSDFSENFSENMFSLKISMFRKIICCEKNLKIFAISKFLKIYFRHEKIIFFFQIFFLTRYGHLLEFPHIQKCQKQSKLDENPKCLLYFIFWTEPDPSL